MTDAIHVREDGEPMTFTYAEILKYHGHSFPGGVAHAFKAMQRAFPLLDPDDPPERREIVIETSFSGPGGRDAFEMVTRSLTDGRFTVSPDLARPERGATLERYVFRLTYRARTVTLTIRDGFVRDEFIHLSRSTHRTDEQEALLTTMKHEMADRLLAADATDVYQPDPPR